MEGLIVLALFVLGLYLVVRLVAKGLSRLSGVRFRAYRQLSNRYGGRYENRGLVDPPTVSFNHNGSTIRVGLAPVVAGQPTHPRTRVVARFSKGIPFRLELFPVGRPAPAQPPKGTRLVRTGHSEFDRAYILQVNDAEIARSLFDSPSIRGSIENLRRLAPPSGILLSINPERLLVQVDRNLGTQAPLLDAAVREALILHDGLVRGVAEQIGKGIEIVAVGAAEPRDAGPPECEVCGDPIVSHHVVCLTCRTPFHRDCWTFIGACSTFGCSCKVCVPVGLDG